LDKAAELVGTVKQFLKVIEGRTAELVNEQKADLILNREQLAKLRVLMGQIAASAQATQQELGHFLEEEVRGLILAHVEDAASAAGRAQAQQFGQEVAAEARKALEESSARATAAAQALEQATKEMRQHSLMRAAGITAGCSFGILAAVIAAAWFYLPSKSEMESLRTERAHLQASIEDLAKRGARIKIDTCGGRLCVAVDTDQGQSHVDWRGAWHAVDGEPLAIPKGY
jgi:G3E family GTPase